MKLSSVQSFQAVFYLFSQILQFFRFFKSFCPNLFYFFKFFHSGDYFAPILIVVLIGNLISIADNNKMNKSFIKKIGNKIRFYRKEKALSQEALAFGAGISTSMIGMIETARNDITLSKIYAIAKALDIEPYQLLK